MDLKKIAEEMQPRSMAARDWVFQVIRTAIVRGELPGEMPLRQDEISAALSVSHIPVREAFRQLEAQGLVRIYPNRGAVVTKLSCKELCDVMDTRILLEVGALGPAPYHGGRFGESQGAIRAFFQGKGSHKRRGAKPETSLFAV